MVRSRPRERRLEGPFADAFQAAVARVASNVRRLRLDQKLTQERLAELAGVSVVGVALIEGARTNVTIGTLTQVAMALKVDLTALVSATAAGAESRPGRRVAQKRRAPVEPAATSPKTATPKRKPARRSTAPKADDVALAANPRRPPPRKKR